MIANKDKFSPVENLVKLFHSEYQAQRFFFNLGIVLFACRQSSGCVGDGTVVTVRKHV